MKRIRQVLSAIWRWVSFNRGAILWVFLLCGWLAICAAYVASQPEQWTRRGGTFGTK